MSYEFWLGTAISVILTFFATIASMFSKEIREAFSNMVLSIRLRKFSWKAYRIKKRIDNATIYAEQPARGLAHLIMLLGIMLLNFFAALISVFVLMLGTSLQVAPSTLGKVLIFGTGIIVVSGLYCFIKLVMEAMIVLNPHIELNKLYGISKKILSDDLVLSYTGVVSDTQRNRDAEIKEILEVPCSLPGEAKDDSDNGTEQGSVNNKS